jgi:tetratricopeptide (TPR) repeat protein
MSDALYERYKDALRRGHVAAGRDRHDAALEAYGEASRLAPDRALPFVGVGNVLAKLGRRADALAAFDAALDRAPADEGALRGRADLLAAGGDRIGAAESLDRLTAALDQAGRLTDATVAASRALELAESRDRRATVRRLSARLEAADHAADPAAAEALVAARRQLEDPAMDPVAPAPGEPEPVPEPPFQPGPATAAVEDAAAAGDAATTRTLALAAAAGHRAAGHGAAAIDVCYIALAGSPAAPDLHLSLAELYLDRGWRSVAADKLLLLARLAELTDDADTRRRVCAIAEARLPEDARLTERCA